MADDNKIDFAEIVELSKRAREFKHQCEHRIYTLRTPTDHEMQVIYQRHNTDGANRVLVSRDVVELALVNWLGVTLADVLEGQPPASVPFKKELVPLLLDRQHKDYIELLNAVFAKYGEMATALDADRKNS